MKQVEANNFLDKYGGGEDIFNLLSQSCQVTSAASLKLLGVLVGP